METCAFRWKWSQVVTDGLPFAQVTAWDIPSAAKTHIHQILRFHAEVNI